MLASDLDWEESSTGQEGVRVRTFEIPLAGAKADILHRAHDVILGRHISYFSGFLGLRGLEFV